MAAVMRAVGAGDGLEPLSFENGLPDNSESR
jgi:hypothetical protein